MPKLTFTRTDDEYMSEFKNIELEFDDEATVTDMLVVFERMCLTIGYQPDSIKRAIQDYFEPDKQDIMDLFNELKDTYGDNTNIA